MTDAQRRALVPGDLVCVDPSSAPASETQMVSMWRRRSIGLVVSSANESSQSIVLLWSTQAGTPRIEDLTFDRFVWRYLRVLPS